MGYKLVLLVCFLFLVNIITIKNVDAQSCATQGHCGNCGTIPCTTWESDDGEVWEFCSGCINQGVCSAFSTQTQTQNCGGGNCGTQLRTRTCSSTCGWGGWSSWSSCTLISGNACFNGQTQNQGCNTDTTCGGSQSRTCSSCQWGGWSSCSSGANCLTKASTDSDNACTTSAGYQTGGTVIDYTGCSGGSCTSTSYADSCSGTTLTEQCASGSDRSSNTKQCQDFETLFCSGTSRYRKEWGCSLNSGGLGYCNDAAVGDTLIENCNNRDGWYCSGSTRQFRNYDCSGGSCTYSITSSEDCATKASTDSDGSATAYTVGGTVTDYVTCSGASCTSTSINDVCSGTVLTERGASGSSYVSNNKQCQDFESNYCSGTSRYRREWGCSGSPGFCNDAAVANTFIENCNTQDGWYGGGNTQTATCGSVDNDASSEYRDYSCSPGSCTYIVTQTKDCDNQDGWYGGGNNPTSCGSDPNSVWRDYYVTTNTGTCTSTTSCSGSGTINCDSQDVCTNACDGTVFISVPPSDDFYVVTNTNTCTSTPGSPATEDCATKSSTDSDNACTTSVGYQTGGTVIDYTGCTLTGCSSNAYSDSCSGTVLTEQ